MSAVPAAVDHDKPVLHLSGPVLRAALQAAVVGCEDYGGIERYVDALKLKSSMFQQAFPRDQRVALELDSFAALASFMATVRRRVAHELEAHGLSRLNQALSLLLSERTQTATTDERIRAMCAQFPNDKNYRWVRDLASEVLHNLEPERYPLMHRWVWDERANTGALREMWFGENTDSRSLPIKDDYETFLVLREELSVFLSDNGFFRDVVWYVDILLAQIYADYICAQGGTYLRTDFSAPEDPMQHTRRMLGLDGVRAGSAKLRMKTIAGQGFVLEGNGVVAKEPS